MNATKEEIQRIADLENSALELFQMLDGAEEEDTTRNL